MILSVKIEHAPLARVILISNSLDMLVMCIQSFHFSLIFGVLINDNGFVYIRTREGRIQDFQMGGGGGGLKIWYVMIINQLRQIPGSFLKVCMLQ